MSMLTALDSLYADLQKIDEVDPVTSAIYRQQAQAILATPSIALKIRTAIADYLIQANQRLTMTMADKEDDSY